MFIREVVKLDFNEFFKKNMSENSNPFDLFGNIYENSDDIIKMESIINQLKNYDIYDFLSRVSGLYLLSENQNKGVLLDALIQAVLYNDRSKFKSKAIMSSGRFKAIIRELNNLSLKAAIDPPENAYVENIMFYDNYLIFTGIEYNPSYCIQQLIKTLINNVSNYNELFIERANQIIQFCLFISNDIAIKEGYSIKSLEQIEVSEILIPNSKRVNRLKRHVVLDNNFIKQFMKEEDMELLYTEFHESNIEDALTPEYHDFLYHPFLRINEKSTIILNISTLSTFAFQRVLMLAKEFQLFERFINDYNERIWSDVKFLLESLGHNQLKLKQFDINSFEQKYYKDAILNVFNNQVMIVHYICDDGNELNIDNFYGHYPMDKIENTINKRIENIFETLMEENIKEDNIFQLFIFNIFGRKFNLHLTNIGYYNSINLNPYELKCVAINEREQVAFIPRYIRSKNRLLGVPQSLTTELNSIEIYVSSGYSFYINDDFNLRNTNLFIAPGDSIEYIIRALQKENRHLIDSYKEGYKSEVILIDPHRNMYTEINFSKIRRKILIKFENLNVWIYSSEVKNIEELNIYSSVVDALSYWMFECGKEFIESTNFCVDTYKIKILLKGKIDEYYYNSDEDGEWKDYIESSYEADQMQINIYPAAYRLFGKKSSITEYQMMEYILKMLFEQISIEHG